MGVRAHSSHGRYWRVVTAAILWFAATSTSAQDNGKCLECHSDAELTGSFAGEEMSMFVAEEAYAASVHEGLACVDCHSDLDPNKRRHSTREDLELVGS